MLDEWATAAVLKDPKRRLLLGLIRDGGRPLTRDELAASSGIARPTVAFHLDCLTEAGLLDVDFARPTGRSGPGSGRPAKRYRSSGREVTASYPERRYDILATILSRAAGSVAGDDPEVAGRAEAREQGRQAACDLAAEGASRRNVSRQAVLQVLGRLGYQPAVTPGDRNRISLRNCPFHAVSLDSPEVVCPLNQQFVQGVLDEMTGGAARAVLDGGAAQCCVSANWSPRTPGSKNSLIR